MPRWTDAVIIQLWNQIMRVNVRIYNLGQIVGTGVTKYLGTVSQSGREKEIAVQTCQKCFENNKRLPPTTDRVE